MTKPLRTWRAEQLLSTRRLAAEAGTSNKTIVQIENGRQTPTFATMEKVCRVLQVEPREITEFALALAERAREPIEAEAVGLVSRAPRMSVVCVSSVASFLTVSRQLLADERYAVTTMIGVPVSGQIVSCLQPDVVVFDIGHQPRVVAGVVEELSLQSPTRPRIVLTGRDRRRLEMASGLTASVRQRVALAPFDRDLRALLATIRSLTSDDDAPTATA